MANEFDGDFTGFDAVSLDRYQAERAFEDSLDSVGGDFERDFSFYKETEPYDDSLDLDREDDWYDEPDIDDDFPMSLEYDDDRPEYDDPFSYRDEY